MDIVETNHSSLNCRRICSWWKDDNFGWDEVLANNGSGGLVLIWDKTYLNNLVCTKGDWWIWAQGELSDTNFTVSIVLIYAPNDRQ